MTEQFIAATSWLVTKFTANYWIQKKKFQQAAFSLDQWSSGMNKFRNAIGYMIGNLFSNSTFAEIIKTKLPVWKTWLIENKYKSGFHIL